MSVSPTLSPGAGVPGDACASDGLYTELVGALRGALLQAARDPGVGDATLVGAYLAIQALVVHCSGRCDLAVPLCRDLGAALCVAPELAAFLHEDVARTYAETQRYRDQAHLPAALADADGAWLGRFVPSLAEGLAALDPAIWHQLAAEAHQAAAR